MFDKTAYKNKNYRLLAVNKNNICYCGIYSNCNNKETITAINSGIVYYNLKDFVNSILETKSENEWKDCLYYNETKKRWRAVKYLIKKF